MIRNIKTKIEYDRINDVAYSSLCVEPPKALRTREEEPEVVVFRDAQTNDIVGFTIMDVKKSDVWKKSLLSLGCESLIPKFEKLVR